MIRSEEERPDLTEPRQAGGIGRRSNRADEVERVLREIRSGGPSREAFRTIYERYFTSVTHFFANRGFSAEEADDLAQEALLRVYRNIGRFRREASFETWLFTIVKNVWKNALRDQSALKRSAEEVPLEPVTANDEDERGIEPEDVAPDPLDRILAEERHRLFAEAVGKLPPKMRQCVLLRIGQDLKYREIATVLKVSIATVKSQLNAAHKRLKPLLEPHFEVFFP